MANEQLTIWERVENGLRERGELSLSQACRFVPAFTPESAIADAFTKILRNDVAREFCLYSRAGELVLRVND